MNSAESPLEPDVKALVPDRVPPALAEPIAGMPLTEAEREAVQVLGLIPSGEHSVADLVGLLQLGGLHDALARSNPGITELEQMKLATGLLVRLIEGGWLTRLGWFGGIVVDQARLRPLLDLIKAAEQ